MPIFPRVKLGDAAQLERNARLFDAWSLVHTFNGIWLAWAFPPIPAFLVMVLWEPFEVLVLSPLLMKRGVVFGYEALPNSLSDIAFDAAGVVIGYVGLTAAVGSPEHVVRALGL